jgi:hypothetical protein
MKTKSLFFAALVLVSAVSLAAGKDEPRKGMAVVPVKGSEIFKVIYKGETTGKVKLTVFDAKANVILAETFNGVDGFIVPLNFTGLAYGEYSIEVADSFGKKTEKVVYAAQKEVKYVHISKIRNQEGKFLLSVINTAGAGSVSVKIFDERNTLIHSETKQVNGEFAQVYKLENAAASYTFEVSDSSGSLKTVKF